MKKIPHRIITLLMAFSLIFVTLGNVAAQTAPANPAPDFSLVYLINGMDLSKDQFEKTIRLTKNFMIQIRRSDAIVTKMTKQKGNNFPNYPNAFERVTVIQHRFLDNIKRYHLELVATIGQENAMKIFGKVYQAVPVYLMPQAVMTESGNGVPSSVTNFSNEREVEKNTQPETKQDSEKAQGLDGMMMGRMGTMGPSMNMGTMPWIHNQPINGSNPDVTKQQLLLQLQTSNTMLIQMLNILQNQPVSAMIQTQIQTIKQLLANQSALIQILTVNLGAGSRMTGNGNTGNMGKM